MSAEIAYITDGLLCKYYHFTLGDVENMPREQKAVLLRFMEMRQRIEAKRLRG